MNTRPLHKRLKQTRFEGPVQEALLSVIVAADVLRRRQAGLFEQFNITHNQYNILRILNGVYPDGHPRCEIIDRMLERAPDVTRLIDGLVHAGYAERCRSDHDKRLSVTKITARGRDLLETMKPLISEFDHFLQNYMTPEECAELARLCGIIYAQEER
jgi:DNA-binding MarR family transcriptional regulator